MASGSDSNIALPPDGDERTLYIVDISGYVFRAYHALPPLTNSKGEPTHAVLGVVSMLLKLIRERRPVYLAVAMDSRTKSFRHKISGIYKANRPPAPPDLKQQMARVEQIVEAYSIAVFQQDGMEADDVIASLTRTARASGLNVVIVSADKDLLQLIDEKVWMFDTMRNVVFGVLETEKKMGVGPRQVRDLLALVGDSSDNVPGVPSVGPKTAAKLLNEYVDLDGIYRSIDEIKGRALKENLKRYRDQAYLSQLLVTLRDDLEIAFDKQKIKTGTADPQRLKALFRELEFTRLLSQLPSDDDGAAEVTRPEVFSGTECSISRTQTELEGLCKSLSRAREFSLLTVQSSDTEEEAGLRALAFAYALHFPDLQAKEKQRGSFAGYDSNDREIASAYVPLDSDGTDADRSTQVERALRILKPILQNPDLPKVSANSKLDSKALFRHGIELQGVVLDTMLASYLLDPERRAHTLEDVASYLFDRDRDVEQLELSIRQGARERVASAPERSNTDAARAAKSATLVLRCARALAPRVEQTECERLMREVEIPLARLLAEMELTGFRIDIDHLSNLSRQVGDQLVEIEQRCIELAGREFNVLSPRQLETILFDELNLPVLKRTKSARSTDHETLEELTAYHQLPLAVLQHRTLAKLKNTYLDTLPKQVDRHSGRIHTEFNQVVTATGRLSSSDPNLQNIPIRSEIGRSIRNAFIAADGWEILSADYSQIELRVLAHLSGDASLVEAFLAGEDVHRRTAEAIFGVKPEAVTREMRDQAKTVNFAVIYGQSHFALARSLRIDRSQAAKYIRAFFAKYAGVSSYMESVLKEARELGYVRTLCGRRRPLLDLNSSNHTRRQAAERIARNTPIQGTAADIIKLAMVAISSEIKKREMKSRMLLTVHDELIFEAPPEERESLERLVCSGMENAIELAVPLVVDRGWGKSWGEAH
ncbi:MAG: DNA polymerase I [Deltaproteobacteria bacterium]|nr:DNA polymerase I [Deltaproteobacteria bacterium]